MGIKGNLPIEGLGCGEWCVVLWGFDGNVRDL